MKIPNTVCSGCNQMLDLIYVMRGEFGEVNEAKCYNCNKQFPNRPCSLCKRNTIHVGRNFRACTDCIIDKGFNLEMEFEKAQYLLSTYKGILIGLKEQGIILTTQINELDYYLEHLERNGYDQKHYTNDINKHLPNSDKGIVVEQPDNRPETD
jgi:hypothetical protein